jgi:hypothetical protein
MAGRASVGVRGSCVGPSSALAEASWSVSLFCSLPSVLESLYKMSRGGAVSVRVIVIAIQENSPQSEAGSVQFSLDELGFRLG